MTGTAAETTADAPTTGESTGAPAQCEAFPPYRIDVQAEPNGLYYRVDEVEDENDWNEDGDENDLVLLRTSVSAGTTAVMGALSNLAGAPAIETDGMLGAAFFASEAMEGADLNNDGDMTDLVLRWFRIS